VVVLRLDLIIQYQEEVVEATHLLLVQVEKVELVVGMSQRHIMQLKMMYPDCQTPMMALDDPPVSDPYGGDDSAYEQAACDIARQLPEILHKIRQ